MTPRTEPLPTVSTSGDPLITYVEVVCLLGVAVWLGGLIAAIGATLY